MTTPFNIKNTKKNSLDGDLVLDNFIINARGAVKQSADHRSSNTPQKISVKEHIRTPSVPYVHPKPFKQILGYKFERTLGQGSMGKVKLGISPSGHKVAVKIIPRYTAEALAKIKSSGGPVENDPSRDLRILREAYTMKLLHHTSIVKLYEFVVTKDYYYMLFEYVKGCQVLDWVVENGNMQEDQIRNVLRQLLLGVEYCHGNSVVHRDLKIENIMIENEVQSKSNMKVKILDFGLSNYFNTNRYPPPIHNLSQLFLVN